MTLKAIFFDHDGTLVNSEPEHCRFWQAVMQQHGIKLSTADYMDLYCCAIRNDYAPDHDLSGATIVVDSMAEAQRWIVAFSGP